MGNWVEQQQIINWQAAARPPALGRNELHVWWLSLQQPAERYARFLALLSEHERQRAARFKLDRHRVAFIAGRGLLRELVGHYLDTDPATVAFRLGPFGKPALAPDEGRQQLCFNYSDAEDRALYVFAWDIEVGADLECLRRRVEYYQRITRKFADSEVEALSSLPEHEQHDAFLVCWTRKEGYGKALGVGIRYPLDSVELCVDCRRRQLRIPDPEFGHWIIHQIYPAAEFTGTVVHADGEPGIRFFTEPPGTMGSDT